MGITVTKWWWIFSSPKRSKAQNIFTLLKFHVQYLFDSSWNFVSATESTLIVSTYWILVFVKLLIFIIDLVKKHLLRLWKPRILFLLQYQHIIWIGKILLCRKLFHKFLPPPFLLEAVVRLYDNQHCQQQQHCGNNNKMIPTQDFFLYRHYLKEQSINIIWGKSSLDSDFWHMS